jgi:undecaprenyl-diphosphatase
MAATQPTALHRARPAHRPNAAHADRGLWWDDYLRAITPLEVGLWLAAALLFAGLTLWVESGAADAFDRGVTAWLQQFESPGLDQAAWVLSLLGSEAIGAIHVVFLFFLLRGKHWAIAAGLFAATAGAGFLNGPIKGLFARERPEQVFGWLPATGGQVYSYPSGHAMVTVAFLFLLVYACWPGLQGWRRPAAIAVVTVLLVVVGLTRLYLGAHHLTDVFGGYLLGFVWAELVILAGHLVSRWRRGHADSTRASPPVSTG